jgi:natural product biosynthesis luciferase-like monooxygenase protein
MFRNRARHLVELLHWRGEQQHARTAVTFVPDEGGAETSWTYGDLDRRARAVAVELRQHARPGDRALLLSPPGADFAAALFGCFYGAIVPVPAYPPGSARQLGRIETILRDARTDLVVTTRGTRARIEEWLGDERRSRVRFLCVDEIADGGAGLWTMPALDSASLAFLQYTSGSTREPRGVMVSHGNLLANMAMIASCMGLHSETVMASWLPMFHDMGLIGNLLEELYLGGRTVLMSPQTFVREPVRWLEAITRHRATMTGAPNFGYALCVNNIRPEQKAALDLSSLTVSYCGSEPIDARVMERFIRSFRECGFRAEAFYACYGMAEVTLLATGSTFGAGSRTLRVDADALGRGVALPVGEAVPNGRTIVGCGYSPDRQELLIVDPEKRRPLPDGSVGEIWIRGPNVTQGYWGHRELTAETFHAVLDDATGPYLRTGDLGFVNERNVFVTGRIKDVIIVRGRNYYPQDIERTATESSATLYPGASAAFSIAPPGETERVVVVCEVKRQAAKDLDGEAIAAGIREAVFAEHEMPPAAVVLLRPATLPKTSSGKVRRAATRAAFLDGTLEVLYAWTQPAGDASADSGSAERADEVIAWLRGYAERRIDSRLIDERRTIPPYIVLDFGNHGLLGLQAPLELGGLALSHRDFLRVLEQLAAIDLTLVSFVGVHNALGLRPLLRKASEAQKQSMLPAVAQGRELASFAFTEPAAGSNPTAIESTAISDGRGGWILRGTKKWIGTAAWSGVTHVFAHVLDEHGQRRGITCFAVPQDRPGLVQGAEELTMGMRGMVQNSVHLNDVRVGPADLLGEVGEGMLIAQDIMEFGRICIAASALGAMKRVGQLMARYARRRSIATGRLLDNYVSRERFTQLATETAALEDLVGGFGEWLDNGVDVPKECFAAVKVLSAEALYRAVDHLMQMLGGRGYIETNLVPQMLRDARLLRIFEGPSETMQMFVGTRLASSSAQFLGFLRRLGATEVAAQLEALAGELTHRPKDSQQTAMLLGAAGLWGFWLAAAKDDSARRWLRDRFERTLAEAKRGQHEPVLASDQIEAAIARYTERIGDLDQYRPGVLDEMDPLLRRDDAPAAISQPLSVPTPPAPTPSAPETSRREEIEQWTQRWIAQRLQQNISSIAVTKPFADLGLDSLTAVELTQQLKNAFGAEVAPTATWDFPNIRALAEHVAETRPASSAPPTPPPPLPEKKAAVVPPQPQTRDYPPDAIAVVGMACRYPGGASDPDKLWSLLREGVDAVRPVPADRWDTEALYDPDPDAPGKLYIRHGAFLDAIDRFDAEFFGISPLEAGTMDPQQRLLLEVAWEALEHAALAPDALRGSRTGIFVGLMYQDYLAKQLRERGTEGIGPYLGTGSTFSAAAGRLSYVLGFHGPSIAVDTACSSSLVSIHLACQSLRNRECDAALAGGANVMVTPEASINLSKARMMSPTGRCRTFDAAADGYTRGEGCGLLVLKRLTDAQANGDRILGLIRGSAVNQDGRSNGLTAPNGTAQRELLRDALAAAKARPQDVGYVECHGTGTPLGDPIEVASVVSIYGHRPADNPLAIGSVKTNFGHLESAAGICGLMKALLVVQHREIPPHLHLKQLNPHIDLAGKPVVIPTQPTRWFAQRGPRMAAVSAFGFVGTNAHVIVEGYDETPPAQADQHPHVLTLSASSASALNALAERFAETLDVENLGDACFTTNSGRAHLAHRLAVAADTPQKMKTALRERPHRGIAIQPPRVAYLFTGQGARSAPEGRALYAREPLFRRTLDACDALLRSHLGIALPSLLFDEGAPLDRTQYAQPALLALGYSLFVQWRAWGVEPSVLIGHSVGEYTAACAAGIFSLEDAVRIITSRARLMQALPDNGGMAAFFAGESWAIDAIAAYRDTLAVAAVNGVSEVVISGSRTDLQRVLERARREGIHARDLPVSHAFHSPLMRPVLDEFASVLRGVDFRNPSLPIVSNVTGRISEGGEMSNPDYWLRHVLATVRFGDAVANLRDHLFLELGPHPLLAPLVARTTGDARAVHALDAPEALAALYAQGASIDWVAVHRPFARRKVSLPTYPFQRERHWIEPATRPPARRVFTTLLGERLPQSAHDSQTLAWEADVDRAYLREHKLLGAPIWPIAAQIDLAISAAREGLGLERCRISSLEFVQTLYSDVHSVQTVLAPNGDLRIYSRHEAGGTWILNTTARIEAESAGASPIDFSTMFFAAKEEDAADRYRLIVEAAKYADRMGFRSVWVPERHFTDMGSLYPNPSVLHAALARETKRVRLMAGSVVLPLHNPVRVAEEWAMVDNLSGGRVGLSLASGWNPNDFVLAPGKYDDRYRDLYDGFETLRRLWRGETLEATSASGRSVALRTYPTPVQHELPLWITAARSAESFRKAGALGANLLTHLLDQDVETLAGKIAIYRQARAEHGFDPSAGIVTVMCHTFVAPDMETVHRLARRPFCEYLASSKGLLSGLAHARKQEVDVDALSGREMEEFVEFLYERFHSTRALIGTPESCAALVGALQTAGVNEIACLLDFGPSTDEVLAHLPNLEEVRKRVAVPLPPREREAIEEISARCGRIIPAQRFYDDLSEGGLEFEGSLRTLETLRAGENEALAEIRIAGDPAVAIDACLQAALAAFEERSAEAPLLVPSRIQTIRVHGPLDARWSHTRRTSALGGNVTVLGESGGVALEIEGLEVRRVPRPSATPDLSEWLYDVTWRPIAWPQPANGTHERPWIVLEDRRGLALEWAKLHAAPHLYLRRGAATEAVGPGRWTVDPDGGFDRIFQQIDLGAYAGILDLWPLDAAPDLEAAQRHGVETAISLVQALARAGGRELPRLWLVTRHAQSVSGEEPAGLAQSTLWGLAGAMAREHSEWWGGIIDLDSDDAVQLDLALSAGDREDQVAIRDGERYARRIVRASAAASDENVSFSPDATYVIAGGMGGLGRATAEWMTARGAKHLLLLGRSPAEDREDYVQVDITDEARLREVFAEVRPPIRGVVHAAGVFHDESLLRLDRERLWKVMRARVSGAWALHRALADADLDFFVLFSSFSALTPPHGQAAYAAASSFLDALAHFRRAAGKPALSINWGAWSEVGFAASDVGRDAHAKLEAMGMRRMTPAQGIAALEAVMHRNAAQVAVFPMDLRRAAGIDAALGQSQLLAELTSASEQPAPPVALLAKMEPEERLAYVREQLARITGEVLKIAASRLDITVPLTSLGLDSLVAVQIRNRMQKEVGLALPLVNALRGGSIASLADDLMVDLRVHAVRPAGAMPHLEAGAQQEIEL